MRNNLKYINFGKVLLLAFTLIFLPNIVMADSVDVVANGIINFGSYGITASNNQGSTSYKTLKNSDTELYCVVFTKNFTNGSFSNCTDALGISTKQRRTAGFIVDVVAGYKESKGWDNNKAYAYKVAALNTYLGLSGSSVFSGGNPSISTIIAEAQARYNNYVATKNEFKALSITGKNGSAVNSVLRKTNKTNTYISDAVVFKGLKGTITDSTATYTFSASGLETGQSAYLCTGSSGTGCKEISSVTVSGTDDKTYYIKVTGVTSDINFNIKISGTVSPTYPKGDVYCKTNQQSLLLKSVGRDTWTVSKTVQFTVPNSVSHKITIAKVDENGDAITGATFAYMDPKPLELSCSASGAFYNCTYGPIVEGNDQFYNKEYCFEETKAPSGFVLPIAVNDRKVCYTPSSENVSNKCYHIVNDNSVEEPDSNYCNTEITSYCKITKTYYKEETNDEDPPVTSWVIDSTINSEDRYEPKGTADCSIYNTVGDPTAEAPYKEEAVEKCGIYKNNALVEKDSKYCSANSNEYFSVSVSDGNVFITKTNTKNSVKISKTDATGEEEVPGAKLKICSKAGYDAMDDDKKNDCPAAKTIDGTDLIWTSTDTPMEFMGLVSGSYYVIETLPPSGYGLVKTATSFSIDDNGVVKTGSTVAPNNVVVVKNGLNKVTISKTDIVTTKEVPGAKLSICTIVEKIADANEDADEASEEDVDEEINLESSLPELNMAMDGQCIPVKLADGTDATWTSGTEPKEIFGLPAGTYYLVEVIAPFGYSTAESILFTMKSDGTLADKDGKSIADNKIEMKDAPITDVKTGMLPIIIISLLCIGSIGGVAYFFFKSSNKVLPRRRKRVS